MLELSSFQKCLFYLLKAVWSLVWMWAERPTHPSRSEFLCPLHRSVSRTRCAYGSACMPSAGTSWRHFWRGITIELKKKCGQKWLEMILHITFYMMCSPYYCLEVHTILRCDEKGLCCLCTVHKQDKTSRAWLQKQLCNLSNEITLSTFNPPHQRTLLP